MTSSDRDQEKERRLNANMIERRRMQNINSGFTSLKRLLPPTDKKQTKAAILQQAVQHILRLQRTVVQVRENNNALRQNLADERKQSIAVKKQFDAFITEKFSRQERQSNIFCSHMQMKGRPLTPPDDSSDRAFNRWPLNVSVNSSEYQGFDRFSCRDSREWGQVPVIMKMKDVWEANGSKEMHSASSGICKEKSAPSYQETSGFARSRDFSESGALNHRAWPGNNLNCIVDAINFLEKKE